MSEINDRDEYTDDLEKRIFTLQHQAVELQKENEELKERNDCLARMGNSIQAERDQLKQSLAEMERDARVMVEALIEAEFMCSILPPMMIPEKGSPADLIDTAINSPLAKRLINEKKEGKV